MFNTRLGLSMKKVQPFSGMVFLQTGLLTTWHMSPCLSTSKSPTVQFFFSVLRFQPSANICSTNVQTDSNIVFIYMFICVYLLFLFGIMVTSRFLTCTSPSPPLAKNRSSPSVAPRIWTCQSPENGGIWLRNMAI